MTLKILIPLFGSEVAPRFDLAGEVMIIRVHEQSGELEEKMIVLPRPSAEQLCHQILTDNIRVLVCGGIEDEYYQYLTWKRVQVLDSVAGPWRRALELYLQGKLESGAILYETEP